MTIMHGRRYCGGRLERAKNYAGNENVYIAKWTDATGRRRKRILSSDRRVAQRAFNKLIRERDLQVLGLSDEQGQERPLEELREAYLRDMETWAEKEEQRARRNLGARQDATMARRKPKLGREGALSLCRSPRRDVPMQ